jgi:arylsulfatase A-like enzyme
MHAPLLLETLEDRLVLSTATAQHELLLSVDGLHNADISDPRLTSVLTNIKGLQTNGVTYTNASTTSPSDSFPGTLSYLTGAGPGTTGVFYDDSYSRTLLAPGSNSNAQPGTEVTYFEAIDKNSALLSGGGNFDASSIDPSKLPIDPTTQQVVYPNQFLQVNTIFDIAHQAGLYTAFSDKHPAYQIADGNNPQAINDLYTPEINSTTALLDNATGKTVNANALLNDTTQPAQGLSIAPGYNASVFAAGPRGATQPDSIVVDGLNVYVGYQNGAAKDGSSGSSTIAEFAPTGPNGTWAVVKTVSVAGHNDGLKVDPSTHKVWALQNEDANPNLVVIDFTPATPTTVKYTLPSVNGGGGYDDIAFVGGKAYLTASNPTLISNTNIFPAVVQITLGTTNGQPSAALTPILYGNAQAKDVTTGQTVTLNLTDPDSMTVAPNGDLVFTSQADNELVDIHNPGPNQVVQVLPLTDAAKKSVSVDDTLFNPGSTGEMLVTDQQTGIIYQVTVPGGSSAQAFSAAQDLGELGITNLTTGVFTPVVSGLGSPRGLAFLNAGAFTDLSNFTLVDPSTDPQGPNDPNLINDTTTNVLLTEKYDDLKVHAILNEIKGQKSHNFFSTVAPQIPAIFGMNFQAVSVAQKDAHGGINLLPNGQEGAPSALLEGAMMHTDQSIGKIVAALKQQGIWDSTQLYLVAKHGQDPRVGLGGLMSANTLPDLLNNAGDTVAQATQDDVSLIWLQNQATTMDAVQQLQNLKATGTLTVYFQGVPQTLPANQVIDQILADTPNADASLGSFNLGNPATDSTTPDIVVTLKPGYIWVGNVNSQHKRAEHGGFSEDDTHVALIVSGGALPKAVQGTKVTTPVKTQQIAVSVLQALGLDPAKLTGAVTDHTKALPGLTAGSSKGQKASKQAVQAPSDESSTAVVSPIGDPTTTIGFSGDTQGIPAGTDSGLDAAAGAALVSSAPDLLETTGQTNDSAGTDQGTVANTTTSDSTISSALAALATDQTSSSYADAVAQLFAKWQALGGNGDLNL